MDVLSILVKMRQPLEDFSVEVSGERAEEHPNRFLTLEVVYRLKGALDEKKVQRAIQLSETKYCSVEGTLRDAVPISSRYEIEPPGCIRASSHYTHRVYRRRRGRYHRAASHGRRCVDRDHELSAVLADDTRYQHLPVDRRASRRPT